MRRVRQSAGARLRREIDRNRVENGSGRRLFRLGPSGEGSAGEAGWVDNFGNIKTCARFDAGCEEGFDVGTWCD